METFLFFAQIFCAVTSLFCIGITLVGFRQKRPSVYVKNTLLAVAWALLAAAFRYWDITIFSMILLCVGLALFVLVVVLAIQERNHSTRNNRSKN